MLTSAAFGRLAALDVSVVAPHGAGAGQDAAATQVVAKVRRYAPYLRDLAAEGIAYRPLVWTAWGRPHDDAATAVASMAAAAGRRLGVPAQALAARARTAVGVAIWRRAARMVAVCGPRLARDDVVGLLPAAGRALRAHGAAGPDDPPDVESDVGSDLDDTLPELPAHRLAHSVPALASPARGTVLEPAAAVAVGVGCASAGCACSGGGLRAGGALAAPAAAAGLEAAAEAAAAPGGGAA